ncbi:hypothetical protein MKW98_011575 [Papaver atlanticum]|uniref:Uncharacterized protein n=1 Tax=Papaver atlanticum TaxID=357466 RepID=A0AAD4S8U9_9MAGN|nr:hypothetical protein MKW98_011575 [Papaver atlanticum]
MKELQSLKMASKALQWSWRSDEVIEGLDSAAGRRLWLLSKRRKKAAKFIEYDSPFSEEEKKQAKTLKISCNLSNAACKLKLKSYKEAEKFCIEVAKCVEIGLPQLILLVVSSQCARRWSWIQE